MTWTWRYEDEAGATLAAPEAETFESRSDAESWLGVSFAELAEQGVAAVTLLDGQKQVYGPMSLSAGDVS